MRFASRSTVQISSASGISTSFRRLRTTSRVAPRSPSTAVTSPDRLAALGDHLAANQVAMVVLAFFEQLRVDLVFGDPQFRSRQQLRVVHRRDRP